MYGGEPHHKSRTTETGVAIARIVLNAYPLVAGRWKALINVILTVRACPTCQKQKPTERRGEPRLSHFHPLKWISIRFSYIDLLLFEFTHIQRQETAFTKEQDATYILMSPDWIAFLSLSFSVLYGYRFVPGEKWITFASLWSSTNMQALW